jgi:hypothetical protein
MATMRGTHTLNNEIAGAPKEPPAQVDEAAGRPGAGHNNPPSEHPTFKDNADAVARRGPIVVAFERLGLALRDPRCQRPHLRVLYHLMERLNRKIGTAFPNRRGIGEKEELEFKTVENVLYDLRKWGYIDWERRAESELHKGRLLHYTLPVARWSVEEITEAIVKWRQERDAKSTRPSGDSEHPPRGGQKVPVPEGTPSKVPAPAGEKVPVRTGEKVPAPAGDSNLVREPVEGTGRKKKKGQHVSLRETCNYASRSEARPPSPLRGRKDLATEGEIAEAGGASQSALEAVESEAFCAFHILGWVEETMLALWRDDVDPESVRQVVAVCSDRDLIVRIKQACDNRVRAHLLTSAGCFGVRYFAAVIMAGVVSAGNEAVTPAEALDRVLQAMRDRIGSRQDAWLNSLALIGHRIAGELYTTGDTQFYRNGQRPKEGRVRRKDEERCTEEEPF